jgi:AraC-like DNA-binding protein
MLSACCKRVLKEDFEKAGIVIEEIRTGMAILRFTADEIPFQIIDDILCENGMARIENPEMILVEKIKTAVIELIHRMNNVNSIIQKSEYLVEKLGQSYRQLSSVFSRYESITLERFIILNKIERIKELIDSEEFTLSEIAYMMDYNSVQYLSNQFKKETGVSVSEYKLSDRSTKKTIEEILKM